MKRTALYGVFLVLAILIVAAPADAANRTDPDFVGIPASEPEVGSDGCPPAAFISGSLPWNDTGDTCAGFTNGSGNYAGTCGLTFAYGGEDVVYEMTLTAGNSVGFSMDLTGSTGDLALFILGTCGDSSTCIVNSQDAIGPGAGPEVIDPANYPAGTYYVYVDSYYAAGTAGSCGIYDLTVTGNLPAELVSFSAE